MIKYVTKQGGDWLLSEPFENDLCKTSRLRSTEDEDGNDHISVIIVDKDGDAYCGGEIYNGFMSGWAYDNGYRLI